MMAANPVRLTMAVLSLILRLIQSLLKEPHVLALPHGENGWMMTVERLLEARPPRTDVWLAPSEQGAQ